MIIIILLWISFSESRVLLTRGLLLVVAAISVTTAAVVVLVISSYSLRKSMIHKYLSYKSVSSFSLCWVNHSHHHLPFVSAHTYSTSDPISDKLCNFSNLCSFMYVQLSSILLEHDIQVGLFYKMILLHIPPTLNYTTHHAQVELYIWYGDIETWCMSSQHCVSFSISLCMLQLLHWYHVPYLQPV